MTNPRNAQKNGSRDGFTLIELLMVVAIIAVVSVIVLIVVNPAELLRQSRDSARLASLETINKTIGIFAADQTTGFGIASTTYLSVPDPTASTTCGGLNLNVSSTYALQCSTTSTFKNTNGSGWIPLALNKISSGVPISQWPVDPTNATSAGLYFTYGTSGSTWDLSAGMESVKYNGSGNYNVVTKDGGQYNDRFEIGTNLTIMQFDPSAIGSTSTPTSTPPAAPVITSGPASTVGTSTATISWTTDQLSNSTVNYGASTAYGFVATGADGTSHSVFLSSLTPSSTYHYQVQSSDAGGTTTSSDYTFTTSPTSIPITFDSSSTAHFANFSSVNTTINIGAGNNEALLICQTQTAAGPPATMVTVQGTNATELAVASSVSLWYYAGANTTPSTWTIVATGGSGANELGIASFFGVNQTSPLDSSSAVVTASTKNPTAAITSSGGNELAVDCLRDAANATSTATLTANGFQTPTSLSYLSANPVTGASYLLLPTATTTNMGWQYSALGVNYYLTATIFAASP